MGRIIFKRDDNDPRYDQIVVLKKRQVERYNAMCDSVNGLVRANERLYMQA